MRFVEQRMLRCVFKIGIECDMNRSYQFQNQRSFKCSENTRAKVDFKEVRK